MALRFIDGFDHYGVTSGTDNLLNKWTGWSNTITTSAPGRFGVGAALNLGSRFIYKNLDSQGTWTIGMAVNTNSFQGAGSQLLYFADAGTVQMDLQWDGAGRLRATRNGSTILATGTTVISLNTWYYVEYKILISDSVGTAELRINGGTPDFAITGQDTKQSANATADAFLVANGNGNTLIDDLYVCDGTGSAPQNSFLGDVRVETLYPNGNGNSSQWVGSDSNSTDNYLLVDETDPNDDTDYVESATVGNEDTYTYSNLVTTSGTIYAVQLLPWAKKTSAGLRQIVTVARLAGTEEDSLAITLPSSYTYVAQNIRTTKPGGGVWTVSDVNSAEFGPKVSA